MTNEQLPRPLQGIRIIECGVWHAGPGANAILSDLGAEVIKIESLVGDPERHNSGRLGTVQFGNRIKNDWSLLYEISNRGKKSICVDIESLKGREIVKRLAQSADIFLTNYKATSISKLGVDYETIRGVNPKIIHITVSGYGAEGPMAGLGGFDPLGQALSGMLFISGADEPIVLQVIILDQLTAITASHAMLTALLVRDRHGYGQSLHVSLYGTAVWAMYANLLTTSVLKKNIVTAWNRKVTPALRNCYRCGDGKWIMGTHNPEQKYWPTFCDVMELNELSHNSIFATQEARDKNIDELIALIDHAMLKRTAAEWLKAFQSVGLMFVPVQTAADVLVDPQARANGYIVDVDHPTMGRLAMPGYPVNFSANGTNIGAAPDRGQHTQEVLTQAGYSCDEIDGLKRLNVIK